MIFGYIDPGTGVTIVGAGASFLTFLLVLLSPFLLFFKQIFHFFKKHKIILVILLLIIGTFIILWIMHMKRNSFNKKIFIIGMDALSPKIVEELMAKNELPHFSALQSQGGYKHLSTTNPPQSPVAWSAFSTGKNPGENGIFDFIIRDPQNYRLSLSTSKFDKGKHQPVIKAPRFWQYLSQKNVPVNIIGCPITFPPDKIKGHLLAGMGVPDILGTEGTFSFYTTQASDLGDAQEGRIYFLDKESTISTYLYGPRIKSFSGKEQTAQIPLKITLNDNDVIAHFQRKTVNLKLGQWSDWQEVSFKVGFLKKMKGIFKFYLSEVDPDLKLYVSPINIDPREPFWPISYPKQYSRELVKHLGLYATRGMPFDTWAVNENRLSEDAFLEQVHSILEEKQKLLDFELTHFDKGVFYFYFESPDIIQHMFWRYLDPKHPLYDQNASKEKKDIIYKWYKKMDVILGRVMKQMRKEDTLIVLSDHGFGTFRRAFHINNWLKKEGYLFLREGLEDQGRPLLVDVDWSRTKAYAIGFGSLYINEKGRESQGIVSPGEEKERLKKEIKEKLENLIDEKYQERIVTRVYLQEEVFKGKFQEETPDLLVGFNEGYRASWQTAVGATPSVLIEDNLKKWSGSHLFDSSHVAGVLFCNKKILTEKPKITDITPTILQLIGVTSPEIKTYNLNGKSFL